MLPQRINLIAYSTLAVIICYIDRVNISVAIIPMQEQFGWSDSQVGFIFSSFLSTFALLLCSFSIYNQNFIIFAIGNFLIGSSQAFSNQYRFAASESVSKEYIPRSIDNRDVVLLLDLSSL